MSEQSTTTDSATTTPSIEERLTAVFAGEPEAAATKPAPADDANTEVSVETLNASPEETQEETTEQAEDTFDLPLEDGTVLKLPVAAKSAVELRASYTQKVQHVAALQQQAEDRLMYAEARANAIGTVINDVTELRTLQSQLQQYQSIDWDSLYRADSAQAFALSRKMDQLKEQAGQKAQLVQQKIQQAEQMTHQHVGKQWELAEKGVAARLGQITQAENKALAEQIEKVGFSIPEFKARFADARVIELAYKASKWDQLQSGKSATLANVTKAPPVVKPGVSQGQSAVADKRYRDVRQAQKKTGSIEDTARVLMMRMK